MLSSLAHSYLTVPSIFDALETVGNPASAFGMAIPNSDIDNPTAYLSFNRYREVSAQT